MKKILIIHTAFIGDVILSTPLIKKIKAKYADSEITYMTTPAGKAVLENNPLINEFIVYDKKKKNKGVKAMFKILSKLRKNRYDLAVLPHRYLRTNILAYFAGIKERIGYKSSEASFLLSKKVFYKKGEHEVERLLNLIEYENFQDKEIDLYPKEKEEKTVDGIWKEYGLEDKKNIVIAPGSRWKTKMWPIEYYNDLIEKLLKNEKNRIIVVGGKEEKDLSIKSVEGLVDLRGKTSLLDLAEIIKRSDILVSNDSSPLHIASAFDTFVIAIFGATVKELGFTPWTKNSIVVENAGLYCRPCGLHGGNSCPEKHFKCMLEIKADKIYKIINEKLEKDEV